MSNSSVMYNPPCLVSTLRDYYMWLCELINVNQTDRSYWLLVKGMYEKKFYWSVPNDDNRVFDGKELFQRFCDENNIVDCEPNENISMLELIIILAYHCENIMDDQSENIPMREWFWKLLANIELDICTDEYYSNDGISGYVDEKLNRIIDRTYNRNGKGGLFPLKRAKNDQRKVELWYQMCAYLVENYYIMDSIM